MDLISVIVPVYKVEPYLDRCVQSIVDQTYRNLEIILVDDGSPDHCPQMCDAWAQKDSRIKVIHQENGGLSAARNRGMDAATGELIGFVDSDDWIDPPMYQCLYDAMIASNSDIASCGAKRIWTDGTPAKELQAVNIDCCLEREASFLALITSNGLVQTVWNKLYRKSVIAGTSFPVGLIHEDEFWTWQIVARSQKLVTLKESYYNYLQRDSSIMGAGFSEHNLLVVQAKTERQNYIEKYIPALTDASRTDLTFTCMHLGIEIVKSMTWKNASSHMKYLKNTIKTYPISKKHLSTLSWKQRLHLKMIRFFFAPVCFLHSL